MRQGFLPVGMLLATYILAHDMSCPELRPMSGQTGLGP